jgi:hypothetical protein
MNTGMDKRTEWVVGNAVRDFARQCEERERAEGRRWVPSQDHKSAGHYEYLHADGNTRKR